MSVSREDFRCLSQSYMMGNEAADVQKGQSTHQAPRVVLLHQYHRKAVKSLSSTRRVQQRDHHRSLLRHHSRRGCCWCCVATCYVTRPARSLLPQHTDNDDSCRDRPAVGVEMSQVQNKKGAGKKSMDTAVMGRTDVDRACD